MRRYLAGMLLILMVAQSSGAAVARTSSLSANSGAITSLIETITSFVVQT